MKREDCIGGYWLVFGIIIYLVYIYETKKKKMEKQGNEIREQNNVLE